MRLRLALVPTPGRVLFAMVPRRSPEDLKPYRAAVLVGMDPIPRDIRIALDAAKATKATWTSGQGRSVLPVRIAGARVHVRVAEVEIYAVLVIE